MIRNAKVMIVDDDPYICEMVRIILSGENIELLEAGTGEEALNLMEEGIPDIIIQDLNLPDMSGIDLNHMLLSFDPELPIVALTGVELKLGDTGDYRGFVTFILKPIEPEKLLQIIHRFLRENQDPENLKVI